MGKVRETNKQDTSFTCKIPVVNSSSTISWMAVRSFTTSNKPGMQLWLLTFIRHMMVAFKMPNNTSTSVIAFTTCWVHLKLHQETPNSLFTTFSTLTDSDYLLGQVMRRTPSHGLCSRSQHGWVKEKQIDFVTAGSKFSPIAQCSLSLLLSMLLHSQHPTTELHDPTKNLHKLKINSPHKINCNLKTKMIHNVPEYEK